VRFHLTSCVNVSTQCTEHPAHPGDTKLRGQYKVTYGTKFRLPNAIPLDHQCQKALCRCIEIDVWDGEERYKPGVISNEGEGEVSPKGVAGGPAERIALKDRAVIQLGRCMMNRFEPIDSEGKSVGERLSEVIVAELPVLHGFDLTKEILFRNVCQNVMDYAFTVSDLPIIVSSEVHCNPLQQNAMVDIMEEIWGGFLLPVPGVEPAVLPSPEQLRGNIPIKVKYVSSDKDGSKSEH
jgi:phosphatidylinositol phospholipase C delta